MRYHNITKDDMLNGDGLRVVLWVAGCVHGCKGCHNQSTWDPSGGIAFDDKAKEELYAALKKNYVSGITFSGGDPLHPNNIHTIEKMAKEIKEQFPSKTIWLYTGDVWEEIHNYKLMRYLDVLVDGEFEITKLDTKAHWKGSTNQRVIDVQASLAAGNVILHA